jgi:hypothetical protein
VVGMYPQNWVDGFKISQAAEQACQVIDDFLEDWNQLILEDSRLQILIY